MCEEMKLGKRIGQECDLKTEKKERCFENAAYVCQNFNYVWGSQVCRGLPVVTVSLSNQVYVWYV